jgi:hypothetical protein
MRGVNILAGMSQHIGIGGQLTSLNVKELFLLTFKCCEVKVNAFKS